MSWPGTDFELEIQNRLDALEKVAAAAIAMRQRFGDEYEGRFADLDAALDAWTDLMVEPPNSADADTPNGRVSEP